MKLKHLWLACPLPAAREATTVYADRLPLGNPLPLKILKHSIGMESRPAELASLSERPHKQCCSRCQAATSKTNSGSCQLLIRAQGWSITSDGAGEVAAGLILLNTLGRIPG